MSKTVGIIGYGNMGSAIASRLKHDYHLSVFDHDPGKTALVKGIAVAPGVIKLVENSEAVILAVKPQDIDRLLTEIAGKARGKLIISIAAGITTAHIEKNLPVTRVVRVMPNMPARAGASATCLCLGASASEEDLHFCEVLFDHLGESVQIEEALMNASTAITGSGPGFCFYLLLAKNISVRDNLREAERFIRQSFVPELTLAAEAVGFQAELAVLLAAATGKGCIALLKAENPELAVLVKQVASKGGTTEAGLEVLRKGGNLVEAAKAALKRAEELSPR